MAGPAPSAGFISVLAQRRIVAGLCLSRSRWSVAFAGWPLGRDEPMMESSVAPFPSAAAVATAELRAAQPISPGFLSSLRRRALLEGCKWDPQVADLSTLTP